jgi:penicillin-binding protein 2
MRLPRYLAIILTGSLTLASATAFAGDTETTQRLLPKTTASTTLSKAKPHAKRTTPAAARSHATGSHAAGASQASAKTPAGTPVKQASYTTTATAGGAAALHRKSASTRQRWSPWTEPTFGDPTAGDNAAGDDPVVRRAAVEALGSYNGTAVVADPETGRILTIVNQNLAKTGAYQPCSTIKLVVSLASLSENIIDPYSPMHITRRFAMSMTQALAKSNNVYFARLGEELGFERVVRYAKLLGLGEKAGLDLDGEKAGVLPDTVPESGVGMMTSFGDGIRLTALELASIVSSVANGGTLYYLQYPRNEEEIRNFQPRVKRYLDIANLIPLVKPGMEGAVEYGTARRANVEQEDPLAGKTGTCTDTTNPGVHLGWFGSFNDGPKGKLVVVVLLTGGRGVSGPIASGIAGDLYRNLAHEAYALRDHVLLSPARLVTMQSCCR